VALTGVALATVVAVVLAARRRDEERRATELRRDRMRADAAVARVIGQQRISEAGLTHVDLDAVLVEVVRGVRVAFRADSATVLLLEPDGRRLRVRASVGLDEVGTTVPVGVGVAGRVLEERRPRRVDDLRGVEVASPALRRGPLRSLVCAPVLVGGEAIGVVHVGARPPGAFTDDDTAALEQLAGKISLAVDRVRLLDDVREREEALRAVVDTAIDPIVRIDAAGRVLAANPATTRLFGYPEAELVGRGAEVLFAEPDRSDHAAHLWLYGPTRRDRRLEIRREVVGRRRDGTTVPIDLAVTESHVRGRVVHVAVLRDITEQKESERRLAHAALHDPLTGLGNRLLLLDRLERARAARSRADTVAALMFCDLDRFKRINDSYGHEAGDELLRTIAGRLRAELRPQDTVVRLGGDEFVVLAEDLEDARRATDIAGRLHAAVSAPVRVGDDDVYLTTSIGVALLGPDPASADELLRRADSAMYRAKERGRARVLLYDDGMQEQALERLQLETRLHRAVEAGELEVHFQPQYELATGALAGAEALLRWRHPDQGLLGPEAFLGAAEDSGLIVPLGRFVLREACRAARRWPRAADGTAPSVWVNVSGRELSSPGLVRHVAAALEETGLAPDRLVLEVTEGALMEDPAATGATLRRLRQLGAGIAIDDFGTGYSSLAHLRDFPVDAVKLDRTFLPGVGGGREAPLVEAVAVLAAGLGLRAVAEGVETAAQLAVVRAAGYDLVQGFLLASPGPTVDLTDSIATRAAG
jgi:diguanylate cyclase (GGDEF)-like protein/PAS domain S-box-containing protein